MFPIISGSGWESYKSVPLKSNHDYNVHSRCVSLAKPLMELHRIVDSLHNLSLFFSAHAHAKRTDVSVEVETSLWRAQLELILKEHLQIFFVRRWYA